MVAGETVQGRRRPDGTPPADLEPGEYTLRGSRWWLRLPVREGRAAASPLDGRWTVTEHDDGTITVRPSIEDRFIGWHGHLEHGVWREA